MPETSRGRWEAAIVVIAPLFLLSALAYHPYISNLTDASQVGSAMAADSVRWGVSHIAVGAGFGLMLLAFLSVRSYLRESGEDRWSAVAVPFLVLGTTFSIFLPAMETAMVSAYEAGTDAIALQEEIGTWFFPMLALGALLSGVGVVFLAIGVVGSGAFERGRSRIIAGALTVLAISRFVPRGAALFVGAAAAVLALVLIGTQMWSRFPADDLRGRGVLTGNRGVAR